MENMIQLFKSIAPLTDADCESLMSICKTKSLEKGEHWIAINQKNHKIAFIEKGYLRKYYLKEDKEITDYFYFENDLSADLPSIIGNFLPQAGIIAMEKSELITFSYFDFIKLCSASPAIEHFYRLMIEQIFLRFYKRTESFILKTPLERYNDLMHQQARVFQKATQYHIASYLGISPQHLSRLRNENTSI
ncbi:MAG: hypothetical protein CMO01_12850 [Thalassobius sp.]|nr:hypothetical protein [Thalassovita sp.]